MTTKKNNGSELERNVRAILKDLQSRGLCYLWKLPTDLRLTRNGIHHGEPMPADFMGFRCDGRGVLLECKDVDLASLPLGRTPGPSPFQMQGMHFAQLASIDYILLWKRKDEFVTLNLRGDVVGEGAPRIPWKLLPKGFVYPMSALPAALEAVIMSQYETPPIPNGSPVAPRPRRLRHRSAIRRAGPPPASH